MPFNISFDQGFLPTYWKRAYIAPLFKYGSSSDPSNYRPIVLTCIMCKIMETVIKTQMENFIRHNQLNTSHQHGFLSKHSTPL